MVWFKYCIIQNVSYFVAFKDFLMIIEKKSLVSLFKLANFFMTILKC